MGPIDLSTFYVDQNRKPIPTTTKDTEPPWDIVYKDTIDFLNSFDLDEFTFEFAINLRDKLFGANGLLYIDPRNYEKTRKTAISYFLGRGLGGIATRLSETHVPIDRSIGDFNYYTLLYSKLSSVLNRIVTILSGTLIRLPIIPCTVCGKKPMLMNVGYIAIRQLIYDNIMEQIDHDHFFIRLCHDIIFYIDEFVPIDSSSRILSLPIHGILPIHEDDQLHKKLLSLRDFNSYIGSIKAINRDIMSSYLKSDFLKFDDWDRLIPPPED